MRLPLLPSYTVSVEAAWLLALQDFLESEFPDYIPVVLFV